MNDLPTPAAPVPQLANCPWCGIVVTEFKGDIYHLIHHGCVSVVAWNRVALAPAQRDAALVERDEARAALGRLVAASQDVDSQCSTHAGHCISHHQRTPCAFEELRSALAAARAIVGEGKA